MLACEPVNRFMTEAVLAIDLRAPAGEILRMFTEYPVHHLPVVDRSKVVGMLSSADVAKLEAFVPKHAPDRADFLSRRVCIETLMRQPPITIRASDSLEQAATLMATHGIHALPVTDRQENLLGIITTTDIMHAALHPERRKDSAAAVTDCKAPSERSASVSRLLRLASAAADRDDENGEIAHALLRAFSRLKMLEHVLSCADRYLRAGQDEHLHAALVKAIGQARETEQRDVLGL